MENWSLGKSASVAVLILVAFGGIGSCTSLNVTTGARNMAEQRFADVQVAVQQRGDKIPNLVEIVKGVAGQENAIVVGAIKARADAQKVVVNIDPTKLKAEDIQKLEAAQATIAGVVKSLFALKEAYPTLKSDRNFLALQHELAESENLIAAARRDYNNAVRLYKNRLEKQPSAIVARTFGDFKPMESFKAEADVQGRPKIKF